MQTTSARLMALLRLFEQRDYAVAFRRGRLWMNTLEYFRGCEGDVESLRGDPYEGISAIFQPARIGLLKFGDIEISPESLAAPLTFALEDARFWNVFCMFSLSTRGQDELVSAATLPKLKQALQLPEQCVRFGSDVVVILDGREFQNRVIRTMKARGLSGAMGFVDYYDEQAFHGAFDSARAAFQKPSRYAYQREYRIVVHGGQKPGAPLELDIGDIQDITVLTTPNEFNEQLQLRLPDGSTA